MTDIDTLHGIATVAWILTRNETFSDAVERAHLRKGEATAMGMLRKRFSEAEIEAAAEDMMRAIADERLPATYDERLAKGLS